MSIKLEGKKFSEFVAGLTKVTDNNGVGLPGVKNGEVVDFDGSVLANDNDVKNEQGFEDTRVKNNLGFESTSWGVDLESTNKGSYYDYDGTKKLMGENPYASWFGTTEFNVKNVDCVNIFAHATNNAYILFVDGDGNVVERFQMNVSTDRVKTIRVPSNSSKLLITNAFKKADGTEICLTPYVQLLCDTHNIKNIENSVSGGEIEPIWDGSYSSETKGGKIYIIDGSVSDVSSLNGSYAISQIDVSYYETISLYLMASSSAYCHFVNESGTIIESFQQNSFLDGLVHTYNVPENASKLLLSNCFYSNSREERVPTPKVIGGIIRVSSIISKIKKNESPFNEPNQWKGKKWFAYGTSITETDNAARTGKYAPLLAQMGEMVLTNRGWSGQGIGNLGGYSTGGVYERICTLDDGKASSDLITLETGANDTGIAEDKFGDIYDTGRNTLCGCLNDCIRYLQANTNAQIVVMPSPPSNSMAVDGWKRYMNWAEMIRRICDLNRVYFLNPSCGLGKSKYNATGTTYIVDQIHQTQLGGYILAKHMWMQLRNIPNFLTALP